MQHIGRHGCTLKSLAGEGPGATRLLLFLFFFILILHYFILGVRDRTLRLPRGVVVVGMYYFECGRPYLLAVHACLSGYFIVFEALHDFGNTRAHTRAHSHSHSHSHSQHSHSSTTRVRARQHAHATHRRQPDRPDLAKALNVRNQAARVGGQYIINQAARVGVQYINL